MFKILKYRQFESQEEYYWKTITLPEIYPSTNHSEMWIENYVDEVTGNFIRFTTKDWDFKTHEYELMKVEKKIIDAYESNGKIYIVDEDYKTYELDDDIEVRVKGKRVFTKDDPYGEETWESKINEIFDSERAYEYKYLKRRKMMQFTDFIYTFTSKDNVEYYVTLSYNKDFHSMSVKFTDKDNFKGIMNKIKDKYVNLDNFDAINVLNTIVKICKDFYDKNKEMVKKFTTCTLDEKRLRVYKYILNKYFKGWVVSSYRDQRDEIVINCEPPKNKNI